MFGIPAWHDRRHFPRPWPCRPWAATTPATHRTLAFLADRQWSSRGGPGHRQKNADDRRGSAGVEAADEVSEVLEAVLCRGRGGTRRRRSGNEEGGLLRMRLPAQPFAVCGPRQKLSALSKLMMAPKPCFESAAINRSVARSSRARISVSAIPKRPAHSSTETVLCDLAIKAALRARNSSAQEMDQGRRQTSKNCNCTNQSLR